MPDQISYTPVFQPPNWRDNIDRVSADGSNGFNIQFAGLLNEFNQLSSVVTKINAAIAAVGTPPPTQVTITFTPTLTATDTTPWSHLPGVAVKPQNATSAHGMMSVNLPSGVKVLSLRVSGQNSTDSAGKSQAAGILLARLQRQSRLVDGTPPDILVAVQGTGATFDASGNVDTQFATVDTSHKYFIIAQLDNAGLADTVLISSFQISYMTA